MNLQYLTHKGVDCTNIPAQLFFENEMKNVFWRTAFGKRRTGLANGTQGSILSTFYSSFFADILAPKISNPKHSFVIFGAKISAKNARVKC